MCNEKIYWDSDENRLTREKYNNFGQNRRINMMSLLNKIIKLTGIELDSWDLGEYED